jgi:hypothetical protein
VKVIAGPQHGEPVRDYPRRLADQLQPKAGLRCVEWVPCQQRLVALLRRELGVPLEDGVLALLVHVAEHHHPAPAPGTGTA